MNRDVLDQLLEEMIAGYSCTALKRRAGLRQSNPAPATYPLDFLHCLPENVQQQYRVNAALVLVKAYELGPLDEVPEETAMDATYDDWLLAEARVALRTAREVERLTAQVDAVKVAVSNHPNPCELYDDPDDDEDSLPVSCGWKNAYQDVLKALEVGE